MTDLLAVREKYRLRKRVQNHHRYRQDSMVEKNFPNRLIEMRKAAAALELPAGTDTTAIASLWQGLKKL